MSLAIVKKTGDERSAAVALVNLTVSNNKT